MKEERMKVIADNIKARLVSEAGKKPGAGEMSPAMKERIADRKAKAAKK